LAFWGVDLDPSEVTRAFIPVASKGRADSAGSVLSLDLATLPLGSFESSDIVAAASNSDFPVRLGLLREKERNWSFPEESGVVLTKAGL